MKQLQSHELGEGCLISCDLHSGLVFVLKQNYKGVLCCLTSSQWPRLIMFYKAACKRWPQPCWAPGQLLPPFWPSSKCQTRSQMLGCFFFLDSQLLVHKCILYEIWLFADSFPFEAWQISLDLFGHKVNTFLKRGYSSISHYKRGEFILGLEVGLQR